MRNPCLLMCLLATSCRAAPSSTFADAGTPDGHVSSGDVAGHTDSLGGEGFWLQKIGTGETQTRKVCSRGASDPVARALCETVDSPIRSLRELYARIGLPVDGEGHGQIALSSQSSGVGFQSVSQLNPRLVTTTVNELRPETRTLNNVVVAAFSRGDQAVELAAHDPASGTLNFYLFVFQQACNDTCSAVDLLSERIEQDWTGWTLYGQQDLDDTPLGCSSCHQPGGPQTPTRLLMRDLRDPWFRWFVPAGMDPDCTGGQRPINTLPDLRAMFSAAHAAESQYGGITLEALQHADGHVLFSLLGIYARLLKETTFQEPFAMDTQGTLTEWRCHAKTDLWRQYQAQQQRKGLPVPYYGFDKLDAREAAAAFDNYPQFLAKNSEKDPLSLLRGLVSSQAQVATGAAPPADADGEAIARIMCARCHDHRAPVGSKRARFSVDEFVPGSTAEALRRIDLDEHSPYVMPPRRAGALPEDARIKLRAWLTQQQGL